MPALRLRLALVLLAAALAPAGAAAAPTISGADGDVWNAATAPPVYVVTGAEDSTITWRVLSGRLPVPGLSGRGPSPLTVTLGGAPDGRLALVAEQTAPPDRGSARREFSLDTTPPGIDVDRPVAGAVYAVGQRVVARYACTGAVTCNGTVADGAPLDTSTAGSAVFAVTAADGAGNTAERRVEYRVGAGTGASPAPPPAAAPAGTPAPPSPPIRIAPPTAGPGGEEDPPVSNPSRLRPAAGAVLSTRRPALGWTPVPGARLYNVQVYRVRDGRAAKILSLFPRGERMRVPAGALAWDARYAWRVWPLVRESYPASPHGQSWFEVRRPVRLSPAQLLVNQRIAQAALRRTAAISDWLDAGLVTGDLRDGGLGREDFGGDVTLAGDGTPIGNGLAAPRPLVTATAARQGSPRLRVSARQLLVNQRISQAAVRRANALAARIEGGLTGGDLREGSVGAGKLAPGLRIAAARPAGPAPAASSTRVATATRTTGGRVRLTDRQVLINQRISQAAVRRANALRAIIAAGLTGAHFRDGAITAVAVAPELRS